MKYQKNLGEALREKVGRPYLVFWFLVSFSDHTWISVAVSGISCWFEKAGGEVQKVPPPIFGCHMLEVTHTNHAASSLYSQCFQENCTSDAKSHFNVRQLPLTMTFALQGRGKCGKQTKVLISCESGIVTRRRGVQNSRNYADVINDNPLMPCRAHKS